jgi:hypothetical protein
MDAVVRRDTTFTLRLDAFDGNTSWQAHSRRVGRWTLLVQQYDMCHAIPLRGHKPLNRESAHRSSLPNCIDLQNGDACRRKAGRPHPGVPRGRLRERPAERDYPVRGVPVFRVYGSRTPRHWRHVDGNRPGLEHRALPPRLVRLDRCGSRSAEYEARGRTDSRLRPRRSN